MSKIDDKIIFKDFIRELGGYPKYRLSYSEYERVKDISLNFILELHHLEIYDSEGEDDGLGRWKRF